MLAVSQLGRKYGALRSTPDHRDFGVSALRLSSTLPATVDLESTAGPVKDQGQLGACTAFAGCGMREMLYRRLTRFERANPLPEPPVLSPMFLYYLERQLDGTLAEGDTGSTGRTCCKVLNQFGVCFEAEDNYAPSNFETEPTPEQLADAKAFQAGAYHRITTVADMKSCLATGYPFIIGFTVYESFESLRAPFVYNPDPLKEQQLGGHEVLVIGYDDIKDAFKVRNSWSANWGENGNFWMPYWVAANPEILMDAFMIHLGKAW